MSEPLTSVRRVIETFVARQRRGRVVVGVDDAHLLDGLSALVVHQLAQSGGVRLVVTVRTGSHQPDAVTALWKDDLLTRLDLEPLSAAATREVIESTLGGPVDARCAARFRRLTGGNTLFLRQLLSDQMAAGRMRRVAGVWMWDGDVAVSASLSDTVGRQLGRLTPPLALVVDTLSQCEPLPVDLLCDLASREDLVAAEAMGLVTVERTPRALMARLAHPLFGELRRAGAGEMYLSTIRGRLATRLAQDQDADMQATVRRALLTLESDLDPQPELYLESARHAMTLLDLDLADRLANAAEPGAARPGRAGRGGVAGHHRRRRRRRVRSALLGDGARGQPGVDAGPAGRCRADPRRPRRAAREPGVGRARCAVQACLDAVAARCQLAAERARADWIPSRCRISMR